MTGIFVDSIYTKANWAGESAGQDIANLLVYPAMVVLAVAAARNSLRAD